MIQVQLKIDPRLKELREQFQLADKVLGDRKPLLKALGVAMLREVDAIFKAGGKPAWAPLKPSTLFAKRLGKGSKASTSQPLSGLRNTFDILVENNRVIVYTNSPVAKFHEFGTHGPYEIRPVRAKALALPFLPGRDAGGGLTGTGRAGRVSLAGLGRSSRRSTGGFVFHPVKGKKVPGRFAGRAGKPVVALTNVAFYTKVIHPGLPARPMLPTTEQAIPILRNAATLYMLTRVLPKLKGGNV